MRILRSIAAIAAIAFTLPALAQSTPLQGGPWSPGHIPQYVGNGSQPIIMDGGGASGGPVGANISEIGVTSRSPTNTYPSVNSGNGPFGAHDCMYDAPTTNAAGYHFLCFDPNAQGGGLIAYGSGGTAAILPLQFLINGTLWSPAGGFASVPTNVLTGPLQAAQEPAHTGDVTNSAGSLALTIAANAVTNAKMAVGAAAANLGFTPQIVFNVRDYGSAIGTGSTSGDDAALSAAEAAACTFSAVNGAAGVSNATVLMPAGYVLHLSAQHLMNCQNSYEILSQIQSAYSTGPVFVLNSTAPTSNRQYLTSIHFASCVQTVASGGNGSTPTTINTSGAGCLEVADMQFARLLAIDDCRQFSNYCLWLNGSSNRYSNQNVQQNADIRLGVVGYNGIGIKFSSLGSATGAVQDNHINIGDLVSNYHHIDALDLSTANNYIEFSMEVSVSGGYGFHLGGSYNYLMGRYNASDVTLMSGSIYNWGIIYNGTESGSTVTDNSGNSVNCIPNGGVSYTTALAACLASHFGSNSISISAIGIGVNSISSSAINGGADLSGDQTFTGAKTFSAGFAISPGTWADTQTCTAGQISVDASYVYVCTATNVVKRVALAAF